MKKCLLLKRAAQSLKYFLEGDDFVLRLDHKGLQWLQNMKDHYSYNYAVFYSAVI